MAARADRTAAARSFAIALAGVLSVGPLEAAPTADGDILDLSSLIDEALASHPGVVHARALERASAERASAAGAWDNPMFEFALDDRPVDGSGPGAREFALAQRVPFPGRPGDRSEAARAMAAAARETAVDAERAVVAAVKETYWSIFAIDRRLEVLRSTRSTLEDVVTTARTRYEAGLGGQQDLLLALVESGKLQGDILHAEAIAASSRSKLNRLLGRAGDSPVGLVVAEEPTPFNVSVGELIATAQTSRPAVRAAEHEIEAADAQLRLARGAWRPDLEVGAAYRQRPEDVDEWRASVGVALPVWKSSKENAESREAQGRLEAARGALETERLNSALAIEEEYGHVVSERRIVEIYRREILPQAARATVSARAAYGAGREPFLSLLESVRGELELRAVYYETFADAEMHLARLEEAVGRDLGAGEGSP